MKENNKRINFGTIESPIPYPDFLEIQLKSFQDFFQIETLSDEKKEENLYKVFQENYPITDSRGIFVLEFLDYFIDPPKYSIEECIERGLTYSVALKARLKLYCTDEEHEEFETTVQDVYLGTIPYMTVRGSFVINGAERVIVSQLHRSPGVFFSQSYHTSGVKLYSARVIPFKGSWMEFATDVNNVMFAYIDRKKKFPVTTLLRAIGYETDKDILELFNLAEEVKVKKTELKKIIGRRLAARVLRKWVEDFVDEDTGEVVSIERNEIILERDTIIQDEHIDLILNANAKVVILHKENTNTHEYEIIYNTLQKDPSNTGKEALEYIYRQLRNADPPDEETARGIIEKLFFSDKRYDLGDVGRYRLNKKLNLNTDEETKVLTQEDIIQIIKYLILLSNSKQDVDDIDHLSNRRVKTVGEQLYSQFGVGLSRMARTIREKMNVRDNEVFKPVDLVNARTLTSVLNSFFGTNQLSQFMDQTNVLAEVTHKRRLSALGPGGLSRERAGFEVRDVHYTHYGRLCTIETPEGPNIGLISTLSVYAKINSMGFIETPYKRVEKSIVKSGKENVEYLSAEEEDLHIIAQANAPLDMKTGKFQNDKVKAREGGEFVITDTDNIHFMDVSPNQIVSIAASLIPFLEHDDANRALMGSNMQRQAVPLIRPESPIVGTGIEERLAHDSRMFYIAEYDGVIEYVDANEIVVKYNRSEEDKIVDFDGDVKKYKLIKFKRTNQNTCINITPIVAKGEKVKKGQILCDGFSTEKGEIALGRNLMVAFMPWQGYNFEDAVVISEKTVKEDYYTSIHVTEYELDVRDTKRGMEEYTSDIPNVSEEATRNLDENGLIRIGAEVIEGDILIGKITPKGESEPSPEEKLLKAIFGDKAGDVKDVSLRVPPSAKGIVIEKKLFERAKRDKELKVKNKEELTKLEKSNSKNLETFRQLLIDKLLKLLAGETSRGVVNEYSDVIIPRGNRFTQKSLLKIEDFNLLRPEKWCNNEEKNNLVKRILQNYKAKHNEEIGIFRREQYALTIGDELPTGVVKLAKVYVAEKRKLKVGDKMAGRHGNKGVVAKIVPEEDMPFLEDGTPVDIVLNPLGVPSRMNLGQIYESILGWAGKELGVKFATPIFDGASEEQIEKYMVDAKIPLYGKTYLYNGLTGDRFHQPTTVGVIYMLKLVHMVDDKMHARSIGPYSLITQQPLGGKSQFGGQRFGEMEVWALEAFGASNILREILTIKSDDIVGRAKTYEAIVKGEPIPEPGIPESINVLINELKGLALDIQFD
ncbi:MAG: DNA-directed RNA polymerase subunit beta [Bacteroidetes bacterium]|nr:DNA-directed RNA polymerase subunit beta [Bacteroidota bacterium]MBT3424944.1 DNA-directed RNA polymerase subunit beta [Bacteroidota bacterium]MBT4401532.1 DNA-directed RNA polymerase subunit beta [Bacteroidota bacterium]MBT4727773.1 DNA-directed RNA polymerase subunit beta [Bacteroidota bacterium]MBT5991054.1 DNA-directed RNA polymerase subunit beta [Bacteroidota bacterium]